MRPDDESPDADEVMLEGLATQIASVLAQQGCLTFDQLVDHLIAEQVDGGGIPGANDRDEAEELISMALDYADDVIPLSAERLAHLPTLLGGRSFTHHVTASEAATGTIRDSADVLVLADLDESGFALAPGPGQVVCEWTESGLTMSGPPGWLHGFSDAVAAFTVGNDGVVSLSAVEEDQLDGEPTSESGSALLRSFHRIRDEFGGNIDLPSLVMEALADHADAFTQPAQPITVLLAAAGLEEKRGWVGEAGTEWSPPDPADFQERAEVAEQLNFDVCCHVALARVEMAWALFQVASGADPTVGSSVEVDRSIGAALAHGPVPAAFMQLHSRSPDESPLDAAAGRPRLMQIDAFAAAVARAAPNRHRVGAENIRAQVAELLGDALAGEAALTRALAADPDHPPSLIDAAWYAVDRGDLRRAVTYLRRTDIDELSDQIRWLERVIAGSSPEFTAGRNEPCPCGSGRKFKQCHGRPGAATESPLTVRTTVLADKIRSFVMRPKHQVSAVSLLMAASLPEGGPVDADEEHVVAERVSNLARDPISLDVLTWEGGLVEAFLDERGPLLPPDEAALVESWIDTSIRHPWEVAGVEPGVSLDLLNLVTGERVHLLERAGSQGVQLGQVLLTRVVQVLDQHQMWGTGIIVPLQARASAIELSTDPDVSPVAVLQWFLALTAPPQIRNTEDEDLVFSETTYRVPADDADTISAAIDRLKGLERAEADEADDEIVWHQWFEARGERWIRATVVLDREAGELRVSANSDARFERVTKLLSKVTKPLTVMDDTRTTLDDARAAGAESGEGSIGDGLPDDPEERGALLAALDQHIGAMEERWCDESIPALGGLTPRQALDDPTRRGDLLALLDEMATRTPPSGTPPGIGRGFDAANLRRRLGLPD